MATSIWRGTADGKRIGIAWIHRRFIHTIAFCNSSMPCNKCTCHFISALSCCSVDFEISVKTYDNVGVVQVIQVLGFHDTPLNTLLVVKKFVAALPPCKNLVKNASN